MTDVITIRAPGFEHLHVNDMGEGCAVLWQIAASGKRESLVVDVAQLGKALAYLQRPTSPNHLTSEAAGG